MPIWFHLEGECEVTEWHRQGCKKRCDKITDKCCETGRWGGELKLWRLRWCEEVDKKQPFADALQNRCS